MATSLVVNGVSYLYPDTGDQSWGTVASAWAAAVTSGMLQKAGGAFTLTADANFGPNFGLLGKYFTSQTSGAASTGVVRLANTEAVSWRNNAATADIALAKNASDQLTWAGAAFLSSAGALLAGAFPAFTGDVTTLAGAVATTVAKIQGTVVSGTTGTGNVVFSASPTFTGTIAAGALTLTTALAIAQGGTGQITQTAAFNALQPGTTKGDLIVYNGTNAVRFAAGADGTVLSSASGQASGLLWVTPLTNPMTTAGDLILGGTAGAATRLGIGGNNTALMSNGTTASWQSVVTSVAISMPAEFSVSGSPITSSGTLAVTKASQTANLIYAGPSSGAAAAPTFRAAVYADVSPGLKVPTIQKFTSGSGTYTTPSSPAPLYIRVRMVGAGGGGGGSGTASAGNGGDGGDTTWNTTLLVAGGGKGGKWGGGSPSSGGAGGTASMSAGPIGTALSGGGGGMALIDSSTLSATGGGGMGGSSAFGGGANSGSYNAAGNAGAANTGGGGSGGGLGTGNVSSAGAGGGAGGFVDAIITSPSATYSYAVGASGTAGTAGTSGFAGGAGGAGYIEVTEFYQ